MTEQSKAKKQFIIFLLIAYGVTCITGIMTWYGSTIPTELSIFPSAQMFYPAAGVMLAYLLTQWKDERLPKAFYLCFLAVTFVMIAGCVMAIAAPGEPVFVAGQELSRWSLIAQYVMIVGTILCWIMLLICGRERREAYGLRWKNWKASLLCIFVFLVLYFGRGMLSYVLDGQADMIAEILGNPTALGYLIVIPINFLLSCMPFFGEEYGWRFFFQPLLQKRFGLKGGVLILGVLWGLWHLPLNIFYYSPDTAVISILLQIITCISLGIFFGYAFMKTNNIWVPVAMHYINNNMIGVLSGTADIGGQVYQWINVPVMIALNLMFILFIFSRVYKEDAKDKA